MSYLDSAREFYRSAAADPNRGLCCTTTSSLSLPGLVIPDCMNEMNYGCGTTVHSRDLIGSPEVLYVGVGGGMELLQFSYYSRRPGAVLGIDPVPEMLAAARRNLREAADLNPWFASEFVSLRAGDALNLPVEDGIVDVVAQNCLFNIFEERDLRRALSETHRVLGPGGRFILSDPIAPSPLPEHLRRDERLRAMCISGAITFENYVGLLVETGFGTIEVRARRPYRVLDPARFGVQDPIVLESVEIAAIKGPVPADGACVFTGSTAIYFGSEAAFDDGAGHVLVRDLPLAICDKTARRLAALRRNDLVLTPATWFYDGGGCC